MTATEMQTLLVGEGKSARKIAFHQRKATANGPIDTGMVDAGKVDIGKADQPGLFWMGGYKSDMAGSKVMALDSWAAHAGLGCTRFDYSGHGMSGGAFTDGTISRWLEESLAVFEVTQGPQVIVGSSMGGWLALLLVRAHLAEKGADASRIKGLVLIAPAIDMTRALMWQQFDEAARTELMETGIFNRPSAYGEPYQITRALIEDGDQHLFGSQMIETGSPVHIFQGIGDEAVPWQTAVDLVSRLARDDVKLTLVKDGDHRLSRTQDLALLTKVVQDMVLHD